MTTYICRMATTISLLVILGGCATHESTYSPTSEAERRAQSCPVNTTPVCKIGNSSRVRSATKVVTCRCDRSG